MNSKPDKPSLVVYTVLLGQKAELNPPPISPNADFVCLTDQTDLIANGWEIKTIEPVWPKDIPRSSRHPKLKAHLYFKDYPRSIYIDSSILLLTDPEALWLELVQSEEVVFGGIAHSFHVNMLEELRAVSAAGYETNKVIKTQLEFSLGLFKGYLSIRPIWGGILARRHNTQDCKDAMELWLSIIIEHSRRDQLSLPLALRALKGIQTQVSYLDNLNSKHHRWPVGGYAKPSSYSHRNNDKFNVEAPDLNNMDNLSINYFDSQHDLLRVTAERDAITAERDAITAERDAITAERDAITAERDAITAERDAITAERDAITAERDAITAERDAITAERDAIVSTKVWRWTRGLRNLIYRVRTLVLRYLNSNQ